MPGKNVERRLNFQYAMVHGAYWMYYGVLSSFSSVFLLARGFSNSQIGMIIALGNIIAVAVQPFMADFADRSRRVSVFAIARAMTAVLMVMTVPLITLRGHMAATACCYVGAFALMMVLQPFCNALSRTLEETGVNINFGLCRSMGSLLYAVIVYVLGILVTRRGEDVIQPAGMTALAMLLIVFTITRVQFGDAMRTVRTARTASDTGGGGVPRAGRGDKSKAETDGGAEEIGIRQFAARRRMFIVLCVGTMGVYVANAIMNTYMAQIIANVGGNSKDLGTVFSVLAFLEIPTLILFKRINKRFSCETLLKFSAAAFVVWIGICSVARNVATIIAAQLIQPFSFALFLPAMVTFIDGRMERGEAVKGHALFVAMTTAAAILASLVGGMILDGLGAKALLVTGTVVSAAGALVIAAATDRAAEEGLRDDA